MIDYFGYFKHPPLNFRSRLYIHITYVCTYVYVCFFLEEQKHIRTYTIPTFAIINICLPLSFVNKLLNLVCSI